MTTEMHEYESITFPIVWQKMDVIEGTNGQRFRKVLFDLKARHSRLGKVQFEASADGCTGVQKNIRVQLGERDGPPR